MSSVEDVKKLREMTGAGFSSAKEALDEAKGDLDKAVEILRKKGLAGAAKKAGREARQGLIDVYSHGGRIAAMVEVNCETDFVARTDDFKNFAHDIAMHVAATNPQFPSPDDIPEADIEKEKEIYRAEVKGKPEEVVEKIVDGKLQKFYEDVCLSHQKFIKDPDKTIEELRTELVSKIGENVVIRRFARWELGESQ